MNTDPGIAAQGWPGQPLESVRRATREARIVIAGVSPAVDNGAFAAKRVAGDVVTVQADIFTDGHQSLAAELLYRADNERGWQRAPMRFLVNDRWVGEFPLRRTGPHSFRIEAWIDVSTDHVRDLEKKRDADERPFRTQSAVFPVQADRERARFASWYELFPRSQTDHPARHGTFADVIARLPAIRDMGFDVLYLPPIHPVGTTNRKGRNNVLRASDGDPGSVYAIGSRDGGHDAIEPQLGTLDDFRALMKAVRKHGMELALDYAVQCSPDHPWLKEHPGWFDWRADGSIKYAENPPKIYEDIVNVDFYARDATPGLWLALRDIVLFWAGEGVRIFRVDNPHTKPFAFWRWMIADVRAKHPDIVFLSEAFTRPKVMYHLAKIGFTQSYTYFTWRDTKHDLTSYMQELTAPPVSEFFRPNFFVNTPDINPYFLQTAGRPGFLIRAALAATLSGLWGMYSGFELCEAEALTGREEYLDSEKYEIKPRDWNAPGNIIREITQLNALRNAHPALQTHMGLTFYNTFNDHVLYYAKHAPGDPSRILVMVSLDPHGARETAFEIPLWEWGLADHEALDAEDLLSGNRFTWHGKIQRERLFPEAPYRIWRIAPAGRL